MTDRCTPRDTPGRLSVTALGWATLMTVAAALFLAPLNRAQAAESLERSLLVAARRDLPLARRLGAAARILAAKEGTDAAATARAAFSLVRVAPETSGWLLLRAADHGWVPDRLRGRHAAAIDEALASKTLTPASRAALVATGLIVGRRPDDAPSELTQTWPLADLVAAILRREVGTLRDEEGRGFLDSDAEGLQRALENIQPTARALDLAVSDDPTVMRKGMDGLLALGAAAVPLLLHEARLGAAGAPRGRMARAARAMLALGFLGDKRATPILAKALGSSNGWVRVAAATALGDLGDPAGAVALAAHLTNTGDVFRTRDQWDYPGASATNVAEADWRRVDYFVVDVAAADALARLGVPGAVGRIIHRHLDPSRVNARIRVFQDAHDALRRALSHTEAATLVRAYNVDAGVASRDAAFLRLAQWWHVHRDDEAVLRGRLDETDPGFRKQADALVAKLRGTDVRSFMITKPALAILGRAATPSLIAALAVATRGSASAELARTLGLVRDPRAVGPLLGLLKDRRAFVRAAAAEALAVYVDTRPDVLSALVDLLSDPQAGPRVSALKALVAARPSEAVRTALQADASQASPSRPKSADWIRAETVVRLVQEGAGHLDAVMAGLQAKDRHVRESWWRLLRLALHLPNHVHDAHPAPEADARRRLSRQAAKRALAARRSP